MSSPTPESPLPTTKTAVTVGQVTTQRQFTLGVVRDAPFPTFDFEDDGPLTIGRREMSTDFSPLREEMATARKLRREISEQCGEPTAEQLGIDAEQSWDDGYECGFNDGVAAERKRKFNPEQRETIARCLYNAEGSEGMFYVEEWDDVVDAIEKALKGDTV